MEVVGFIAVNVRFSCESRVTDDGQNALKVMGWPGVDVCVGVGRGVGVGEF